MKIKQQSKKPKNPIKINIEKLDEKSAFSQIFLTSVFHDNISELKKAIKREFYALNDNSEYNPEELESEFERKWEKLKINETESESTEELKKEEKRATRIFWYSFSATLMSLFIQLSYIITIIYQYSQEEHYYTDNIKLICIRIVCFTVLSVYLKKEFDNGKNIFNHGLINKYLYRSTFTRIISILSGLFQCLTAISTLICSVELIIKTQNVSGCVGNFTCLVIITDVDNWIGEYYISTNNDYDKYIHKRVEQISVTHKYKSIKEKLGEIIITLLFIFAFIFSLILLYKSVKINLIYYLINKINKYY